MLIQAPCIWVLLESEIFGKSFQSLLILLHTDLLERNIDRRLFEIGFLYPHNVDKSGNPLGNYSILSQSIPNTI